MALNKSKGNMYEWITHTWNPLAGECPHGCSYCSTNKLMRYPGIKNKYSGPPRLHEKELKTNLGKCNFIFVCAQSDLFASDVKAGDIRSILDYCSAFDNKYLFQSKSPYRIGNFDLPDNSVVCTTIETNRMYEDIMKNCPLPINRAYGMMRLELPKYVTIEPIMDFDLDEMIMLIEYCEPVQVNIGADSGNNNLPEPSKEKILALISELEKFTKVKQKSNLARLLK